jgi:hypothetical protein
MRLIGFSSGALAYGDFRLALDMLKGGRMACVELSALRVSELENLIEAIPTLDLSSYAYVSIHAPSNFSSQDEEWISDLLFSRVPDAWPIVMHPDTIHDFRHWSRFGARLAIENMDRRKPIGRTAKELTDVFKFLPEASLCFDLGHARQCDASMTQAFLILTEFGSRMVQVHISEVNSASQHDPISYGATLAFQQIAPMIPETIPIIVESKVSANHIAREVGQALASLTVPAAVNV